MLRSAVVVLVALITTCPAVGRAGTEEELARQAREAAARRDGAPILRAMLARYRSMEAFSAEGEIVAQMGMHGTRAATTTRFGARAARPGRYRVTWTMHAGTGSGEELGGAVWNAGDGAYNYLKTPAGYAPAARDEAAIAMATGVSSGAAQIPALLIGPDHVVTTIEDASFDGEEAVDGEPCWIVSGASRASAKHTLWISQDRLVLRRHRWTYAPPPGGRGVLPKLDDAAIERAFREMGLDPTAEGKERLTAMLERAEALARQGDALEGEVTETYRRIDVDPTLAESDLAFTPPPGTPRKRSLLEGVFRDPPGAADE